MADRPTHASITTNYSNILALLGIAVPEPINKMKGRGVKNSTVRTYEKAAYLALDQLLGRKLGGGRRVDQE